MPVPTAAARTASCQTRAWPVRTSVADMACASAWSALAPAMTWWRGSRSAMTPPMSRKLITGMSSAVAMYPMSLAEPPIRSTANGIATAAIADPAAEMMLHPASSRKLRLPSGPRRTADVALGRRSPGGFSPGALVLR